MTRLRIGVEQLGAEGLRIELDSRSGPPNVIAFAPGGGVHGRYEQDDTSIGLHGLRADVLVLSEFAWELPGGRIHGLGRMHDVEIEAELAIHPGNSDGPPFRGVVRAARVELTADLTLANTTLHAATVELEGLEVTAGDERGIVVRIDRARASTVRVHAEAIELTVRDLAAPDGIRFNRSCLDVETLEFGALDVRVADSAALLPAASSNKPQPAETKPNAPHLDEPVRVALSRILTHLDGHIALDIITDITVPILGNHVATHRFQIAIEDGQIDFTQIDRGFSTLADFVLDFKVKGNKLILEKDIPFVPFDNQTLIEWPLDAAGIALAKRKRIRLADLFTPQFPESIRRQASKPGTKARSVEIRSIAVRNLGIALHVAAPFEWSWAGGHVRLGTDDHAPLRSLRVSGALNYSQGETKPGEITVAMEQVCADATRLDLETHRLQLGRSSVDSVRELRLSFAGVRPSEFVAQLRTFRTSKLSLEKR